MLDNSSLLETAESLTEPPTGGKLKMWIVGVGFASLPFMYGCWCCFTGHAKTLNITMRGFQPIQRGFLMDLSGNSALSMGAILVSIGLFIHFQWFWGNHHFLYRWYEIGKYLSVLGVVISSALFALFMFL